ncbi:MAG: glycosyltransferase family 2 protein [Bacteroidales bacterium]|nr:glycosyltransferase family 2 protein [Bacteroidales bacterium]
MKKVAVIILNWNGEELLRQYLPSVLENTPQELAEIVVADNGSEDNSVEFVKSEYPMVKVMEMGVNHGYAEGYNRAIDKIRNEYVVLLNSDVAVTADWLSPLLNLAESNQNISAVQPKILSLRNKAKFEHAGACGGFIDKYGYTFCRGRIFDSTEIDKGQYDSVIDVFWASGACLFVKREDYINAGGLDSRFFAHMEEIDLCWRIHLMGKRIICNPKSVVYHLGGATLDMESPRKTYLNFRNNILMLYKNVPLKYRSSLIRKRMFLDGIAALNYFIHGKIELVKAIATAHSDARNMINGYYKNNVTDEKIDILKEMPYTNNSIVYQYFIKKKKLFSEYKK